MRKLPDKANTVNYGESIGITAIPNSIHRSIFLPILILVTPDHHFAQAVPLRPGTFRISTPTLVAAVSSHAHIQTASFACFAVGSTKKFSILQYCSCCVTSHMCQRVDRGDSYIFYFGYMRLTFNQKTDIYDRPPISVKSK